MDTVQNPLPVFAPTDYPDLDRAELEQIYHEIAKPTYLSHLARAQGRLIARCEVQVRCSGGEATTIHHKKGRMNMLLIDMRHFLGCCDFCHWFIEHNKRWAYENGYSLYRTRAEG